MIESSAIMHGDTTAFAKFRSKGRHTTRELERYKFSLNGSGRTYQDKIGHQIYISARDLMWDRLRFLCPFPIEDRYKELYRWTMIEDEWLAWEALRKAHGRFAEHRLVTKVSHFHIVEGHHDSFMMRIPMVSAVPQLTLRFDQLPEHTQLKVYTYRTMYRSMIGEMEHTLRRIQELCCMSSTPGHIKRVWPDLLGLMPGRSRDKVLHALASSPIPDGCHEIWDSKMLRPQWAPSALEWMNTIFTEAIVLPKYDDEDHQYPEFNPF
jgi:hypothetical protein